MDDNRSVKSYQFTGKPFQSVQEANKSTGLGISYLRKGCRNNTIPHIKAGSKYLINVPLLLQQLEAQSMET